MRKVAPFAAVIFLSACGGSSRSPAAPTPTSTNTIVTVTPVTPATPTTLTLSGRVVSTVSGQPLSDLNVSIPGYAPTKTDVTGAFQFTLPNQSVTLRLTVTAGSVVIRETSVRVTGNRAIVIDAIQLANGFDLKYYEELVRNGFEGSGKEPLRRWTQNPRVYLRTTDDRGRAVGAGTLAAIEQVFTESTPIATSGKLRIAAFERGTGDRIGQSGWITVRFTSAANLSYCGRAQIATDGGWIEYNLGGLQSGYTCRVCPSESETDLDTIRHELGHALGFHHTRDRIGIMSTEWNSCRTPFSAQEILHGSIAYSRPLYNLAPDADPPDAVASTQSQTGSGWSAPATVECGLGHLHSGASQ